MKLISPKLISISRYHPLRQIVAGLFVLAWVISSVFAEQIVFYPEERRFNDSLELGIGWFPWNTTPVYYTLNGTEPGPGSPIVFPGEITIPIRISTTTTIRAKSLVDESLVASATFIAGYEAVFFSPISGTHEEETAIAVSAPYASNPVIYYTLDGSEPTLASAIYTTPFLLKSNLTIKAMVWTAAKGPGLVQSATYAVTLSPVQFLPGSGEVLRGDTVSLTAKSGTSISYLIDPTTSQQSIINSNPTDASLDWQSYTVPLVVHSNTVIFAKAEKPGFPPVISQASYQIGRLPRPLFDPPHGPVTIETPVTITTPIAGAVIHYTLDGTEPTEASPEYTGPLPVSPNSRLKARVYHPEQIASYTRYTFYRSSTATVIPPPTDELPHLTFTKVSESDRAVWITHAGDGSGRLFIVQLNGTVGVLDQGPAFLTLPAGPQIPVLNGPAPAAEILSIAFPPDYDSKAYFYCSYRNNNMVRISKFFTLSDPDIADAESEVVIGDYSVTGESGQLLFGPDGTLYLNRVGSVASHMPDSFFRDSDVLAVKLTTILQESGGKETEAATSGSWPFRNYFNNATISTVGALNYRGLGRRMQGRYFCGDRSSSLFTIENSGADVVGRLLARPTFAYSRFFGDTFKDYPFDIVAMGEGEDGRLYVSNYGTTIYTQSGPGGTAEPHIVGGGIYRVDDDETIFNLRPHRQSDGLLSLAWHTAVGLSYQLQTSENLTSWQNYLPRFIGIGDDVMVNNLGIAGEGPKFYRIRVESEEP